MKAPGNDEGEEGGEKRAGDDEARETMRGRKGPGNDEPQETTRGTKGSGGRRGAGDDKGKESAGNDEARETTTPRGVKKAQGARRVPPAPGRERERMKRPRKIEGGRLTW